VYIASAVAVFIGALEGNTHLEKEEEEEGDNGSGTT
jgi:hypothetical protein